MITKKNSMRVERTLADTLIKNKIAFKFREIIEGHEVDFIIGRVVVEVDGIHHDAPRSRERDKLKNEMLVRLGYIPLHFAAKEVKTNPLRVLKEIKKSL